jgi:hypothetical protein
MSSKLHKEFMDNSIPKFKNSGNYAPKVLRVLTKDLIGYKKVKQNKWPYAPKTIALLIPAGAIVHCASSGRKCRASKAYVLDMYEAGDCHSLRTWDFKYKQNQKIVPTLPFSLYTEECAAGIHFFWSWHAADRYFL